MWEKSNVNFYNKIILKIAIFLIGFGSFLGYVDAATIESKSTGGNWSSPITWVGGVVPGINDKAIVNGNIVFGTHITVGEMTINNNGSVKKISSNSKYNFNILGKTINNGTIGGITDGYSENVRFNFQNGLENNGYIFGAKEIYIKGELKNNGNIDQHIYLLGDTIINGTFYHGKVIVLNGYTLNIPKDSYIYGISGTGNIYSSTSNNGNNEKIYIDRVGGKINTNFEYLSISEIINSINGRNIIVV
ncbi:hypothetical protein HUU51_03100 [Candidatus Gracilibacteria bacterium]|nr:hypothetical protein [Candidatus Gracilibacteria bacterium]